MSSPLIEKVIYITRHVPSSAQKATAETAGYVLDQQNLNIVFNRDQVEEAVVAVLPPGHRTLALVSPGWALLELLRRGFTVLEFQNFASARQRGVFLCEGMHIHTLHKTEFVHCPVPPEAQEEDVLGPPPTPHS